MNRDDYIPPYSKQFAYRVNKIKEMREQLSTAHKNDLVLARENSCFPTVSADESKLFSGSRTFGLVRPLSVGRNRPNNNNSIGVLNSDDRNSQANGRERSKSVERFRGRHDSSLNTSTSLTSRNAIEFNKALQLNRDIAAEQKLRESLLQVKKEAYVKYLRAKIDHKKPSWIPSGDGAKHIESMHTSINRAGLEKSLVQKAWRRSPWPGLVTAASIQQAVSLNTSVDIESERDHQTRSKLSPNKRDLHIEIGHDEDSTTSFDNQKNTEEPIQANTTHQYVVSSPSSGGSHLRVRAMSYDPSPDRRTPSSPMSTNSAHHNHNSLSRAHSLRPSSSNASLHSMASNASPLRKRRASSSNLLSAPGPAHVALTVRLINASKSTSNSKAAASASNSYGILAVRASCSRAEFIGAIERQFGVFDQISDVSVASKYGYSSVLTFTSLSLGTLGEQVELNDSSEVNVYLGGTLYQEGDNKDFLHFLEDELTHYEGKYSSYTQYGGGSGHVKSQAQDSSQSNTRRRTEDQGGERNFSNTPRVSGDRQLKVDQNTLRVTSGRSASPRAISTQSPSSLRQAQLQQHVQSLGINRQFEQPGQVDAPNSPRHHPFSRPTAQLPVPYNVTHSFETADNFGEQDAFGDEMSRTDTYEEDSAYPLEETDNGGTSQLDAEEYLDRRRESDSNYHEERIDWTNYDHVGARSQFDDYQQQHPSVRDEPDFTIADLMPSATKKDPLTAAQRAFLSPQGKFLSLSPSERDEWSAENMTTPMATRSFSHHHPVGNENELTSTTTSTTTEAGPRRTATRADAIHEKILHRVATPAYKKPSSSSNLVAPPVISDYSFQSDETAQALTHSKKGRSVVAMKAPPQSEISDKDDDTYLLSEALKAKPVTAPIVDRVAQFSYSALLSPSLLSSSFHAPRLDISTAARSFAGSSSEETKSGLPALKVVTPPDLVLNSYVQGILQEANGEDASPDEITPNSTKDSPRGTSNRPLADVFKTALSATDTRRDIRRAGSLTIDTDSSVLLAEPLSSSHSKDSGDGSTYGSILLSPSFSPMAQRAQVVDAAQESKRGDERVSEIGEQHVMESTLLQYLEQERQHTPPAPAEQRPEREVVQPHNVSQGSLNSQQGDGPVRSAVVTSFLEKVQQRRLAKQQTPFQHQQLDDLQSDRNASMVGSSSGGGRPRVVQKAPIHEAFIDLADLMG